MVNIALARKSLPSYFMLLLLLCAAPGADAQWVQTNGPGCNCAEKFPHISCLIANGTDLYAGSDSGVSVTSDSGLTWTNISAGLTVTAVNCLAVMGQDLYAGTALSVYRGTKKNGTWSWADIGPYATVLALAAKGDMLFAGTEAAGVMATTDSGRRWKPMNTGLSYQLVNVLVIDDSVIFAGTRKIANAPMPPFGKGIFRSTDNGQSWKAINDGLGDTNIWTLTATGKDVFAAVEDYGQGDYYNSVFNSSDTGNTWKPIFHDQQNEGWIAALTLSDTNLFIADINSRWPILLTSDRGTTWMPECFINSAGSTGGARYPRFPSTLLVSNGYLFTGAEDGTVWRRPLSDMLGKSEVAIRTGSPLSASVSPNPFSQTTTIHFYSTESSPAQITIINLLGIEVARLFDGELATGEHSFTWDAKGMTPGMYWCEARMNGNIQRVGIVLK